MQTSPRTPITIIRLEGLECQEGSAGMVQTQCNARVMRSTALGGSGLKNYKADAEPGYIPLKRSKRLVTVLNGLHRGFLSVQRKLSYDHLKFDWKLGRIPAGRSDFYGYRRLFFYNLSRLEVT